MATVVTSDYSSASVISERLNAVIEKLQQKTKSDVDIGELQTALALMIRFVTTNPSFIQLKLKNMEEFMSENEKAANDEIAMLLSPWLDLANLAYEEETKSVEAKLSELGYTLINHSKDVDATIVGHYLAFHPKKKEFLIGVKGTSSMEDVMTDVLAVTIPHKCLPHDPFTKSGLGSGFDLFTKSEEGTKIGAHEGILAAALNLKEKIAPFVENLFIPLGYDVKIVGHSLGAGVSSLLAILLRAQFVQLHGRLHAYCFATPPVLDIGSAKKAREFVTTVANRSDCVVRMSLGNAEVLIRTLEALHPIMEREGMTNFWNLAHHQAFGAPQDEEFTEEEFGMFVKIVEEAQDAVDPTKSENLFAPGKIIALYGTIDEVPSEGEDMKVAVKAVEVDNHHKFMRYIDINGNMVSDHLIDAYTNSLTACLETTE